MAVLRVLDLVTDKDVAAGVVPGLERAVAKSKGVEFGSLLHELGADYSANPYSPQLREILLQINPECAGRLPKRRVDRASRQPAEPPEKPAKETKGPAADTKGKPPAAVEKAPAKKKPAGSETAPQARAGGREEETGRCPRAPRQACRRQPPRPTRRGEETAGFRGPRQTQTAVRHDPISEVARAARVRIAFVTLAMRRRRVGGGRCSGRAADRGRFPCRARWCSTKCPQPLVPKQPRTEADRDHLEALALFATGRMHEQREEYAEALRCYQRALRCDPQASAGCSGRSSSLACELDRNAEAVRYALKAVGSRGRRSAAAAPVWGSN